MKKAFTLLLVMAMLVAALLPMSVQAATELKNLTITMELPDPGKAPTTTATCGTGYTIHGIDWKDSSTNKFLEPGEKIQGGRSYYVYLWVEAKDGYRFASIDDKTPNVNVTVNGESCTATKAYEYIAPAMVYVEYYISNVPTSGWIRTVDLTIQSPQIGQKPTYGVTGPHYASGNISFGGSDPVGKRNGFIWEEEGTSGYMDPDATFVAGKKYSLRITLIPEDGYKFAPRPTTKVNGKVVDAYVDYDHFLVVNVSFQALTHTHTPSARRTTGMYHYKVCTECGDMLDQEDHKGGKATCTEKAKCQVCGTAYGQNEPEHTWSPTYLYQDATGHAWICADCKATSAIEKHNPGPAATNTTPQTCKDCGYIIVPAKNHTHELTKVPQTPATCLEEGNIEYYACSGCNNRFTDAEAKKQIPDTMSVAVGALGHTPSDVWGVDDDYHWRVCTTCNQVLDETKMQHDVTDGKCTTCNYVIGTGETNPETTPAETTPEPGHNAEQSNNTWIKILLVALVCFAAAITVTVIILKKKKK